MPAQITKSLAWLWIASLMIATAGVSVHKIYCYCVGITTVSLFEAEDKCHANIQEDLCQKPAGNNKGSCCDTARKQHQGCNSKTTKVFKLKTEFTLQEKGSEPVHTDAFELQILPVFPDFFTLFSSFRQAFPTYAQPPPIPGRIICLRHGVFRC